jgi:hypothetical protein
MTWTKSNLNLRLLLQPLNEVTGQVIPQWQPPNKRAISI